MQNSLSPSFNPPTNTTWVERSLAHVWHPCTQMQMHENLPLIPISHGKGTWLYDMEGRRYLDAVSSWWVNLFGHANSHINAALRDQLERLEHVMLAGFTHEPVIALSEKLSELTTQRLPQPLGHAFYASDGASATEIAMKMSAHYWRNQGKAEKQKFIALKNSYHGETLGALAVTDVAIFRNAYEALLNSNYLVQAPDTRLGNTQAALQDLENCLQQHASRIAAMIVEPLIQCATGFSFYEADYLRQAKRLCEQYHVHLIADEIAVGCGRTGTFFASEHAGITPDLLCLSKGISGGYLPLSLVLCSESIYQAFYAPDITKGFLHSHSYTGNPLACRAALASLELFEQDNVLVNNQNKAHQMNRYLAELQAHPRVKHFRHLGMIWALDIELDPAYEAQQSHSFARRYFQIGLQHEILVRPIGNTIYFMPPYCISGEEMQHLAQASLLCLQLSLQ